MSTPSVTEPVARQNAALQASLPFRDTQDFADAERGRIGEVPAALRDRLYETIGHAGAWDRLARIFPGGSAATEIERRRDEARSK